MRSPEQFGRPNFDQTGKTQEARQAKKPIEILKSFLQGETRGSAKVKAIADMISVDLADSVVRHLSRELKKDPTSEYLNREFLEAIASKAAINETIRKRKFGKNAAEYRTGEAVAPDIIIEYQNKEYDINPYSSPLDRRRTGLNNLERDLNVINQRLPKKTSDLPSSS